MIAPLPFDAATVFRWQIGHQEVAARAIGGFQAAGRCRAVLIDTADRHWLAQVSADGRLVEIVAGPVTGEQAVHAAECICAGISDHGSVSALVHILAMALVARS